MPTNYKDQFFQFDPASPPPVGTAVAFARLTMTDENDDDDLDSFDGDSVGGIDITASWPGDTVTIQLSGGGTATYTGITFYLADGSRVFTPTDGQVLQNGTFLSSTFVNTQGPLDINDLGPTCFTPGTLIQTPTGARRIEFLRAGDYVTTRDRGPQPVLWAGGQSVAGKGKFAPVRIAAGTLDATRPLLVSPQHRLLIRGWRAEMYFGADEVLVPALHLVNGTTIKQVERKSVTYLHLMFSQHEILSANGVLSESFLPATALERSERATCAELLHLFPECLLQAGTAARAARPVLRKRDAPVLFDHVMA
ncbi:MAG: Hint domain-containing protein [Pseudomonadota bacterium]